MSASETRDLRTGAPVWDAYPIERQSGMRLDHSTKADVVLVGAGITGALVAETLTAAGFSPLILDRRLPAMGSTAASTALLQFELDTPLIHLADQIGFSDASCAWRRSLEAVSGMAELVYALSIGCAFRPRKAIYLSGNVLDPEDLAKEAQLRASIGLPSRFVSGAELLETAGIEKEAALLSRGAADLNPVQLTHALLSIALERGARLHAPVEITEVAPLKSGVGVAIETGAEIEAKALIFATGYELARGVPTKGHRRTSTWAFATPPQRDALHALGEAVMWEASQPYLYVRSTVDGRLIVGGEDEDIDTESHRDALIPTKVASLQQKTKALLPWLDVEAVYSWAGTFGESKTGLPTIGPIPEMPHCYAVLGYGGNGITFGYLAARLLQSYLLGKPDRDAGVFAFK